MPGKTKSGRVTSAIVGEPRMNVISDRMNATRDRINAIGERVKAMGDNLHLVWRTVNPIERRKKSDRGDLRGRDDRIPPSSSRVDKKGESFPRSPNWTAAASDTANTTDDDDPAGRMKKVTRKLGAGSIGHAIALRLPALERRRPFFQKRRHPFPHVFRRGEESE